MHPTLDSLNPSYQETIPASPDDIGPFCPYCKEAIFHQHVLSYCQACGVNFTIEELDKIALLSIARRDEIRRHETQRFEIRIWGEESSSTVAHWSAIAWVEASTNGYLFASSYHKQTGHRVQLWDLAPQDGEKHNHPHIRRLLNEWR
jgi:hypothetical protein